MHGFPTDRFWECERANRKLQRLRSWILFKVFLFSFLPGSMCSGFQSLEACDIKGLEIWGLSGN